MKRSKPHPPHTGGTFHRRLQPLYTEKYKVSCSGFLPKKKAHATFMQPLQCVLQDGVANPHASTHMASPDVNNHAAIPMRSATTGSRNAWNYAHRNISCSGFLPKTKPMQHSCSHYNAFCSMTWLTRMHLRTWHHQMTTIMQPFRCDLQPQVQETHRTTPQQKPHATFMQVNSFVMYCYVV